MIFCILLFFSLSFAQIDSNKVDKVVNINLIDTLFLDDSLYVSSLKIDSLLNRSQNNDIFYEQLYESKLTFSDAIIYDITLDTIETQIHFQSLFESFEFLDSLSLNDEYKRIEYNLILNASIDYYQNKSVTTNRLESPLSMALFKEKLDNFSKFASNI